MKAAQRGAVAASKEIRTMTTRTKSTKPAVNAHIAQSTVAVATPAPAPVVAAAPAPSTPVAASAPAPATPPEDAKTFIAPPPADAKIPSVPDGFEPTTGASYRGIQPRTAELVALPLALRDLQRFANYSSVIGATAPPLAEVENTFDVTSQWSTMRKASSAWDAYCRDQEGIAWRSMRAMMGRLKPAFDLATKTNPSIGTSYAGLGALLDAKTVSAQKAAATKKKNKQSIAEGKEPTHGEVGKTRQKAAAKAALAALAAPVKAEMGPGVAAPVQGVAAAPVQGVAAAPVQGVAAAPVQGVAPAVTAGTAGGGNGVTHS
jgi:hypothetical protein